MRRGSYLATAVFALSIGVVGCSVPPAAIAINEGTIVVHNQTTREWRDVLVTVNDHFRGGAAKLAPGGRLTAPLSQFQTGHGQRFERARQNVFRIEVTAINSDGDPVRLEWGGPRKR